MNSFRRCQEIIINNWLVLVSLAGGAWYDVKTHRLPNWWNLGTAVCGLGLCILNAPDSTERVIFSALCGVFGEGLTILWAVLGYLARLLITTVILFPLFTVRVMGAGDIKMMAVMTGCLGFSTGVRAIGYGLIIGAVLALLKMLMQRTLWKRLMILTAYVRRLFLTKEIVPYYQAERDRREGVIPFTVCLLLGFLWYLLKLYLF